MLTAPLNLAHARRGTWATAILESAMSDEPKKPSSDLKKLADELVESMNEDPEMEPGQADTTPAVPNSDDSK
jgi:hypothetical protein